MNGKLKYVWLMVLLLVGLVAGLWGTQTPVDAQDELPQICQGIIQTMQCGCITTCNQSGDTCTIIYFNWDYVPYYQQKWLDNGCGTLEELDAYLHPAPEPTCTPIPPQLTPSRPPYPVPPQPGEPKPKLPRPHLPRADGKGDTVILTGPKINCLVDCDQ